MRSALIISLLASLVIPVPAHAQTLRFGAAARPVGYRTAVVRRPRATFHQPASRPPRRPIVIRPVPPVQSYTEPAPAVAPPSYTDNKGAVAGGLVGAAFGGAIGCATASHETCGRGALGGAILLGLLGAGIGHVLDISF